MTALVGSSGSGKSTIISLVCAFHKPVDGRVVVDGHDLATVGLNSYRSQLGVALQDSFLFDGGPRERDVLSPRCQGRRISFRLPHRARR